MKGILYDLFRRELQPLPNRDIRKARCLKNLKKNDIFVSDVLNVV